MKPDTVFRASLATILLLASAASAATLAEDMVKPAKVYLCTAYHSLWYSIGPIAIFVLVIAGILWAKSDDNTKDRLTAKDLIMAVLIGVTILLVARGVVYLITSAAGGPAFDINVFCP